MARRHEVDLDHASRIPASAGSADLGRRTSWRPSQERRMPLLPHQTNQRKIGALGNGDLVHSVSCCEDPGRHDHAEPGDAEGTDLLFLPREIRRIEAARPSRERSMRRLSRLPQRQPTHVASRGTRNAAIAAQPKVRPVAPKMHISDCRFQISNPITLRLSPRSLRLAPRTLRSEAF